MLPEAGGAARHQRVVPELPLAGKRGWGTQGGHAPAPGNRGGMGKLVTPFLNPPTEQAPTARSREIRPRPWLKSQEGERGFASQTAPSPPPPRVPGTPIPPRISRSLQEPAPAPPASPQSCHPAAGDIPMSRTAEHPDIGGVRASWYSGHRSTPIFRISEHPNIQDIQARAPCPPGAWPWAPSVALTVGLDDFRCLFQPS